MQSLEVALAPAPTPARPPQQTPDPAGKLAKIAANKRSHPDNLACKFFDAAYYNGLTAGEKPAFLACVNSGAENADSGMGCYAMQPADYDRFNSFFKKVLAQYHGVAEDAKHVNSWSLEDVEGIPEGGKLDLAALGLPALSMRVRVGRNLKEFPLPGAMSQEDRVNMETKMCAAFDVLKANPKYGGGYNSLTPGHANFVDQAGYQKLVDEHIMFKDMAADTYLAAAGIASHWPHGRGCYVSGDREFIIWVGEEDHLRIMCMKKASVLNDVFDRLKEALDVVNSIEGLEFAHSEQYGMVTSCPTNLGTGMRASVHIPIPNLTADGTDKKAKAICKPLGLSVRGIGGEHTPIGADGTCDISPSARFCITEAQIISALYNGLKLLKEKEAAAGTFADISKHGKAPGPQRQESKAPPVYTPSPVQMRGAGAGAGRLVNITVTKQASHGLRALVAPKQGLGVFLLRKKGTGQEVVDRVTPGSPAQVGGLIPGDALVSISGIAIAGKTHEQVIGMMVAGRDSGKCNRSRGAHTDGANGWRKRNTLAT